MTKTVWNTPDEANAVMGGQMQVIRALAVELQRLGKLDDDLLTKIQNESVKKTKGTAFNPEADDALQIRLMDLSIKIIDDMLRYIRVNRDKGNLG
jgi:hypothetical protein